MTPDEDQTGTQPEATAVVERDPDEYHPPEPAKPAAAVVEEPVVVVEAGEDEDKPAKKPVDPLQKRIDELTRKRHEAERERDELRAWKAAQTDGKEPEAKPADDIDTLAERKAEVIVANREYKKRVDSWASAGNKDFGESEFNAKCNFVGDLGAVDRPEFMHIITDPDLIEDGHKLVAALADDPEEAMRILELSPIKMSAALVKYAEKLSKPKAATPKAISKAPEPIKPIAGTARANDEPTETDSEDEWFRKRQAQRAGKTTGARF